MRDTQRALVGALALSALLMGGATALKLVERGRPPSAGWAAAALASDWVHVPMHLLLYGALALCCARLCGGRPLAVALAVGAVALAQEGCQSLLFGRTPGWSEAFDLCVDAAGVALALRLHRGARRGEEAPAAA